MYNRNSFSSDIGGDLFSFANSSDSEKNEDPVYICQENNPYLSQSPNLLNIDSKVSEDVISDCFSEGKKLMKEGLLNEAILAFEACVIKEENRSEAWRNLGICHAHNDNDILAISAFLKCYELDPHDLEAILHLGVSYTNEINPFRAITYFRNWIASHTDYGSLIKQEQPLQRKMMENYLQSRAEQNRIMQLYERALQINDKDPDLHIVIGVLYHLNSDFFKAEEHFKNAIEVRANDATLWNKLGATQANGGNYSAAVESYSRALDLKPNYVRVLSNLGISYANQYMHVRACRSYLASLTMNIMAVGVWDHLTISLSHLNKSELFEICNENYLTLEMNRNIIALQDSFIYYISDICRSWSRVFGSHSHNNYRYEHCIPFDVLNIVMVYYLNDEIFEVLLAHFMEKQEHKKKEKEKTYLYSKTIEYSKKSWVVGYFQSIDDSNACEIILDLYQFIFQSFHQCFSNGIAILSEKVQEFLNID